MAFTWTKGPTRIEWYKKAASTAFAVNSLVAFDGSENVTPATSTTDANVGVWVKPAVTASSTDYALETLVPIEVADGPNAVLLCTDVAGTAVATDVGTYIDLSNSLVANRAASANDALLCVGFIDSTALLCKLNSNASWKPPVGGAS